MLIFFTPYLFILILKSYLSPIGGLYSYTGNYTGALYNRYNILISKIVAVPKNTAELKLELLLSLRRKCVNNR